MVGETPELSTTRSGERESEETEKRGNALSEAPMADNGGKAPQKWRNIPK